MRKLKFMFLMAVMAFAFGANAQITTSALGGLIVDEQSQPMIGAVVTATHMPSGTVYNATSNTEGRYNIQGMRPGGPYTVTVSYVGYEKPEVNGITLQLGNTYILDVPMTLNTTALGEVVVIGNASKFQTEKTGAVTNINGLQLDNMPSVTRDWGDVTRLSPYSGGGMSFAGTDVLPTLPLMVRILTTTSV